MSEPVAKSQQTNHTVDPLTSYTRSLHDYTLAQWTESRRLAEEKARAQGAENSQPVGHAQPKEKPRDEFAQQALSSLSSETQK